MALGSEIIMTAALLAFHHFPSPIPGVKYRSMDDYVEKGASDVPRARWSK